MTDTSALLQHRDLVRAALGRILPDDDSPGAEAANVIGYYDRINLHFRPPEVHSVQFGGAFLDAIARARFGQPFTDCEAADQDAMLTTVVRTPHATLSRFFTLLVRVAVAGFLSDPIHGGNKDGSGWQTVGYVPAAHRERDSTN